MGGEPWTEGGKTGQSADKGGEVGILGVVAAGTLDLGGGGNGAVIEGHEPGGEAAGEIEVAGGEKHGGAAFAEAP